MKKSDQILGLHANMHRGDFIDGTPVDPMQPATLAQEDWDGYSGVGDYAGANGNTHAVMTAGHGIRDALYKRELATAEDTGESFDCVVVGGGISGLAAAHYYTQQTRGAKRCLILENHSIFGGEARRNEFLIGGRRLIANQGSALYFPPLEGSLIDRFYRSLGFDGKALDYQQWGGVQPALSLPNAPYPQGGRNAGMFFGARFGHPEGLWKIDPWSRDLADCPFPDKVRAEMVRAQKAGSAFAPPRQDGDDVARALDRITMEEHMMRWQGLSLETIRQYMPNAGSAAGASADVISAYADYAPDLLFPWDQNAGAQMFPGGNAGIARLILKQLIPAALPGPRDLRSLCAAPVNFDSMDCDGQPVRLRLNATAAEVRHACNPDTADRVLITYAVAGKLYRVRAGAVIMAGGWSTWRTITDLPTAHRTAYQQLFRMPCLVINIALRNWRFIAGMGISEAQWFEGLGDSFAVRRVATIGPVPPTITPDDPTVLTLKVLYTEPGLPLQQQAARGRMQMLGTAYPDYERTICEQFTLMFARSGFDAKRDIAGIILNRWGHAYLCAQPGFFFGTGNQPAPREILRRAPFGRIAFANSDLSGIMDHRASIAEAKRAVEQLIG